MGRPGTLTVTYSNPGNTDLPAPLLILKGQNALFQVPGQTGYTHRVLKLVGHNPYGPYGALPPGFKGSVTVSFRPEEEGATLASSFTLELINGPNQLFDWDAVVTQNVPLHTAPSQWEAMVRQAAPILGSTWGEVIHSLGEQTVQLVMGSTLNSDPAFANSLYNFNGLLQYAVGIYGTTHAAPSTPSYPEFASLGQIKLFNGNVDAAGIPKPLDVAYPTVVLIPGWKGYREDFAALAEAIAHATECFPNRQVNVVIVTWEGAAVGPLFDGVQVPWTSAMQLEQAGSQLGDLLLHLMCDGLILGSTTTVIGEGLGNYVGERAARIAGGLGQAIVLNPSSALAGYLPPRFEKYFARSIAYQTASILDTQRVITQAYQNLPLGDLNNPFFSTRSESAG